MNLDIWKIGKAYAQQLIPCSDGTMADPTIGCVTAPTSVASPETGIAEMILQTAGVLMSVAAVVSLMLLMYGGITYTLATGDDEKIRKSKRIMMWSIVGFAVSLAARALAQFTLGIVT